MPFVTERMRSVAPPPEIAVGTKFQPADNLRSPHDVDGWKPAASRGE
jgi:hypothetical protein